MIVIEKEDYLKYFFVMFFLLIIYLAYLVVKPFIASIFIAIILTYISYPLYNRLNKKLKRKNLSASIVALLLIIIISVPSYFIINTATREVSSIYSSLKEKLETDTLFEIGCGSTPGLVCGLSRGLQKIEKDPRFNFYVDKAITEFASKMTTGASAFIFGIPKRILDAFIIFFMLFYLLKEKEFLIAKIKSLIPLKTAHKEKVLKKVNEITYGILYGYIVVSVIQGVIGIIGLSLAGISNPILWGIVIGLVGLIPIIGAYIVWVPATLFKFFTGHPAAGFVLLIMGIIISIMDMYMRPILIGKKAKIHPLLVLIGVLGGLVLFGFIGVIVGPLILSLLVAFLEFYQTEEKNGASS